MNNAERKGFNREQEDEIVHERNAWRGFMRKGAKGFVPRG